MSNPMTEQPAAPISVLLVDDHRMFAESMARLLSDDTDITVQGIALTGSQALDMIARVRPTSTASR
jgi:DNA-binding NarL/FixJ family response regulator